MFGRRAALQNKICGFDHIDGVERDGTEPMVSCAPAEPRLLGEPVVNSRREGLLVRQGDVRPSRMVRSGARPVGSLPLRKAARISSAESRQPAPRVPITKPIGGPV